MTRAKQVGLDEFEACQKCSVCESFCPVLRVEPNFPGPKTAGPDAARLSAFGRRCQVDFAELCTDCRTCDTVCPSGIKPAALIAKRRWQEDGERPQSLRERVLGRPDWIGRAVSLWPSPVNAMLKSSLVRLLGERAVGIAASRAFPRYASPAFYRWFKHKRRVTGKTGKSVVYFPGCYANFNRPEVGVSLVELLESQGFTVVVVGPACCGLPLAVNGDPAGARSLARRNVQELRPYVEQGCPVLFTCPSCGSVFKSYYYQVLGIEEAQEVAEASFDACEYLLAAVDLPASNQRRSAVRLKIAYHQPCHLRAQGVGIPAARLLDRLTGAEVTVLSNKCCGMAGTYGFKREKYDLSMRIGEMLFEEIKTHAPNVVVTDCGACALQIGQGTGLEVLHPVEILWENMWRSPGK